MLNINVSKLKAFAGHEGRLVISWTTGGPKRWSIAHNLALSIRKNTPETRQNGKGVAERYKKYQVQKIPKGQYVHFCRVIPVYWYILGIFFESVYGSTIIMYNYYTNRCTILYANQGNQTKSNLGCWWMTATVHSNVNSYMFKVQYTIYFAMILYGCFQK